MKIELKAKPGYEWSQVKKSEWDTSDYRFSATAQIQGFNVYYVMKPIKTKYDCSYFEDQRLLDELSSAQSAYDNSFDYESCRDRLSCVKNEILRRMNREKS